MKLSVVTPSFEQAAYLEQTIRSVLESTRQPDQYFVIDGGSKDGSLAILQRYSDQLSQWVSEKDNGQADAINKGFRKCDGDIIAWLNSDDLVLPESYSVVLQAFEDHPDVALIYGDVLSIDQNGKTFNVQRFEPYTLVDLMCFKIISQPGVFFRRSALMQAGLMDEQYHFLLDHQLWLRICKHGKMLYIPKTLAAARYHSTAKNVAHTSEFVKDADRIVDWMGSDPGLRDIFSKNQKRINIGKLCFSAYYQLEGKGFSSALKSYWEAIIIDPFVLIQEFHHIAYGVFGVIGLDKIKDLYKNIRRKRYNDQTHSK